MTRLAARLLAALTALAASLGAASAQFSYEVPDDVVEARVLPGWTTQDGTRMTALHLSLAPGWKTYWRAPGDAGIPALFDWSGSANLAGVRLHWPAPRIFDTYGVRTIGYADELVLPMELRPARPGAPIRLEATIDLGVCEAVCIPTRLEVSADLDGSGGMDPAIRAALAARPMTAERAGVRGVRCTLSPLPDGLRLDAEIRMPDAGGAEIALVETGDPAIWVAEPQAARRGDTLHVRTDLVPPRGAPLVVERDALRFTILGSRRAVDIQGCG